MNYPMGVIIEATVGDTGAQHLYINLQNHKDDLFILKHYSKSPYIP